MLKNYLKITWKVLKRRKFFTFISLFGISFTLAVLVLVTAEMDSMLSAIPPESNIDRLLYIKRMLLKGREYGMTTGFPSYYFLNKYVKTLKTPEKVSVYSRNEIINFYQNNKKIKMELKYTDSNYWEILDFVFREGRPILEKEVDNASHVAVISERMRNELFGNKNAIGKSIELRQFKYRIIGVVENVLKNRNSYADVWAPITTSISEDLEKINYLGGCSAMVLASRKSDIDVIKREFDSAIRQAEKPLASENQNIIICPILKAVDWIIGNGVEDAWNKWFNYKYIQLTFMFLFMLLPTLNLVNINISRIMERSSEIAVRKAFGASSGSLIVQFITENIVITLLGSLLGIIAGAYILTQYSSMTGVQAAINYRVVFYYIGLALFFGLISGVYPAYKMSRFSPVAALRGDLK